jgi:flagellin
VRINTNIAAVNTQRNLSSVQGSLAKSVERLSSGLRINRAGDDAAGLSISEKLRGQTKGLNQAVRNAQDGISMIQTAEGGLNETHAILQRMRELAVQASNDTLTDDDRGAIGSEMDSLKTEVDRIATDTQFNTKTLLTGTFGGAGATVNGNSGLQVAETLTANSTVALDVSAVNGAKTFNISQTANGFVTLTDNADPTKTQTLAVSNANDAGGSGNQTLDFSNLGVKITVNGLNAANDADVIADAIVTNATIQTTAGTGNKANFQVGANAAQSVGVAIEDSRTAAIGNATLYSGSGGAGTAATLSAAVSTYSSAKTVVAAQDLLKSLDVAIADVSKNRSNLGAVQNRLEHTIENLATSSENLTASESRIRDADMAKEMVGFTRSNILQQAGTSILAQANQLPQGVLSLLR